ncbi:MAG TPA: thioredoxin domain-containing protein [Myxococcales bacterium]|nr:thioredoxin domain-containing protein [Myxococcales bacterium]
MVKRFPNYRMRRLSWSPFSAFCLALVALLALALTSATYAAPAKPSFQSPPGAEAFSPALQKKLAKRLDDRGLAYEPRTRNRNADGSPVYSNRLLLEASPYLQQHAHNPVNWYPWGDAAFEAARRRGVPVLVSIGYSTCHWCHVMEEESFDDPETAKYLNENFVAIKVDREARPDIDAVYMHAVQAMGINGGWPLNVWVTADRVPFYGGTYFPPQSQRGRPSFRQTLTSIHREYAKDPERFHLHAQTLARELSIRLAGGGAASSFSPSISDLKATIDRYNGLADDEWGGLRQQVKFPSSLPVPLLLRWHQRSGDERSLSVATKSLDAMASGGIHDHLGGGFHRYSTDQRWLVPHFEKMLYDQALLSNAYLEGWQQTKKKRFAEVTRSILDYVLTELKAPGGAFYSATDADSARPDGEMEEGFFFTWTPAEVDAVLGPALGKQIVSWYGISPQGDVESRSVLRTWQTLDESAKELGIPPATLKANIEAARGQLLAARRKRTPPLRDEKIIVEWNGLAISALAKAGFAFNDDRYLSAAREAAEFVLDHMLIKGRLQRIWLEGQSAGPAFLADYSFFIAGLLDLYEASPNTRWLKEAIALQAVLDSHYADPLGGYYRTADDAELLLAREKPVRDGAVPSGNSIEALNLLRLAALTTNEEYRSLGLQALSSQGNTIQKNPMSVSELLLALDFALDTPKEIFLVKGPNDDSTHLVDVLRESFVPNRVIAIVADGSERESHAKHVPLLRYKIAQGGRTTAYVCQNQICNLPTTESAIFSAQLKARTPSP